MYTRILIIFILIFNLALGTSAQELPGHRLYNATPNIAVKSNLLYDLTLGPNLGIEFKLSKRYTLDLPVNYNPFEFGNNRKWKHILVQPELRYWLCESFAGHFLGVHAHYADYNVGNIGPLNATKANRYRGWLVGGGISWGYQRILSTRWSLETTIGLGYAYLDYNQYEYPACGSKIKDDHLNYIGITKVGISLIYIIK
ncbi:DUF3575 domain-containing protein [Bacteroides sp. 519]|uniref:DUF3575 domain-containing protein n=1 Tax=Bacteroides sp. 519 TaxID=2302937 RepID=UPI0013D2C820|nr:DUF3575 domain-containing protein [Bacteroides sp. 519]NDV60442.1 DUF3575 domain-containing protein [Bacteroides sp. 519]